jgi:hypothetical protein
VIWSKREEIEREKRETALEREWERERRERDWYKWEW